MYHPSHIPLVKGDLICIAYSGWLALAVFMGYGKYGNMHYYDVHLGNCGEEELKKHFENRRIKVSYINTSPDKRVAKITEDSLTQEETKNLFTLRKVLFELKKI